MTATHAGHDVATRIAADVQQLTRPIHAAVRGRVITHAPLLVQLRQAAVPTSCGGRSEARRPVPGSSPPARLDVVETLAGITVGIGMWHGRLNLPSPPRESDWQMQVMRMLVGAVPNVSGEVANWLAIEVHEWWHDAAVGSGWNPGDLLKLR